MSISNVQLAQEKCWCLWKREQREDGSYTKIPYQTNGHRARTNDESTWTTYSRVAYLRDKYPDAWDGIGIMFSPRIGLCGIDIDAHDTDKNPLEEDILHRYRNTYAETSPSGKGIHILFHVDLNQLPEAGSYYQHNPNNDIEFYAAGVTRRYFTFTGKRIMEHAAVIEDMTKETLQFLDDYMQRPHIIRHTIPHKVSNPQEGRQERAACYSNETQRRLAYALKNASFKQQWETGHTAGGDPSQEDMSIVNRLCFWMGGDPVMIDEAIRISKFYRPKWDELRGAYTYGEKTINRALDDWTSFHSRGFILPTVIKKGGEE